MNTKDSFNDLLKPLGIEISCNEFAHEYIISKDGNELARVSMFSENGLLNYLSGLLAKQSPPKCKVGNIHYLKTIQPYFSDVKSGDKTFEVRRNDRDFKIGDLLFLEEYDPVKRQYVDTEPVKKQISYILNDPSFCKEDFVILGFREPDYENWEFI